jgi:ADP-heptose:LPS heptosyltransferase
VDTSSYNHLLVFRFSAMGDVAITVPVMKELVNQYPGVWVTFVSEEKYQPFFENIPRLDFFAVDLHGHYKGIEGLYRLYRRIKSERKFTAIADLHNVLRTRILTFFFRLSGLRIKRIDKGREEKKALTRRDNKILVQLPATFQRYADVFAKLGYPIKLTESPTRKRLVVNNTVQQLNGNNNRVRVGIAPFAKHKEKNYPVEEMEKVVAALSAKGYKLYFFGIGITEIRQLEYWEQKYPGTLNIAGELPLDEELMLISNLDLMVSMDSANMHLASLYGVPVVSIWGATHPFAGFYGFGQDPTNIVQAELYCRPCSVFGNKECYRGDWACMKMIPPQQVIDKIEEVLQKTRQR